MAATTIEWSSFLHSTITVSVSVLQDIIKIKRLMLRWKCNCSVVSSVDSEIGRPSEVYKILSVLNKIMLKILWFCFIQLYSLSVYHTVAKKIKYIK